MKPTKGGTNVEIQKGTRTFFKSGFVVDKDKGVSVYASRIDKKTGKLKTKGRGGRFFATKDPNSNHGFEAKKAKLYRYESIKGHNRRSSKYDEVSYLYTKSFELIANDTKTKLIKEAVKIFKAEPSKE
ncbi:hypothetical protein [Helicobacter sp. 11S02629-2]|uniref:hypothetical protein n=1 Tax=Helicobacter sp. 11S02629-2 TaxID=1476195 RepID=UPI000BA5FA33|nr:hypothetical protein [Helicobacter sp. 11S02629-2]PAF45375.1 hypothetical protein BKH40_04085 [Helicobacter sp. 11S02629-2]